MSYMVPGNPSLNVTHPNQQPTNSQPQQQYTHKIAHLQEQARLKAEIEANRTRKKRPGSPGRRQSLVATCAWGFATVGIAGTA